MRFLTRTSAPAPCGIGIDGLPAGLDRMPQGTPVALALQNHANDLLWLHALLQDLLHEGPVFVLAENERQADALVQHAALRGAHQQGRLLLWLMDSERAYARRPHGMQPVFDELAQAGLTPAHALLVLAAVSVHVGQSMAGLQQWGQQLGRWCQRRRRPVVLVFDQWAQAEEVLAPLRTMAAVFAHVAVLGSEARRTWLYLERWSSKAGPLFETRLGLVLDAANQRLAYDGSRSGSARQGAPLRLVEAPDQYRVLATEAAVAGQRNVPADWTLVDGLDALAAASQDAIAATVLLDGGPNSQQQELLRLVHRLRSRQGRALKIVVRETQDKLRTNLERALLRLGANAVVAREQGFARLQQQLQDLADQTFTREIPGDFGQALAGFLPEPQHGYLPVAAFCHSVQAMLERSRPVGLRHCFVRLSLQAHVAHLDVLQACTAVRDGDLLSADADAMYVFLFACAEADVDAALARLFSIAPQELFASQTLYGSAEEVQTVLRGLRRAAERGLPDYSAYFRARADAAHPHQQGQDAVPPTRPDERAEQVPRGSHAAPSPEAAAPAQAAPARPTLHARPLAQRLRATREGDAGC